MGTWGAGPFDNDDAADFSGGLDNLDAPGRIKAIRGALAEAAAETGYLEANIGSIAVAAAGLVAAQLPGGEPISTEYGPNEPIPPLPAELRRLALRALERVAAENSEITELWEETQAWRDELTRLRQVLTGVS